MCVFLCYMLVHVCCYKNDICIHVYGVHVFMQYHVQNWIILRVV